MPIIQLILSIVILSILYIRMIKREVPSIKKSQAIVPVIFGIVSLIISVIISLGGGYILTKLGWNRNNIDNLILRSICSAFFFAGFPEEIGKLLFILISISIFKPKNVYEYLLIGFGVGAGFTMFEEFLYESSLLTTILRTLIISFHAILSSIMATYIGKAKYYKVSNIENKNITLQYVKALLIPIIIHTVYDATNVKNAGLEKGVSENIQEIAVIIALIVMLIAFVWQIVYLIRVKKDTEALIKMQM